MQNGKFCVYGGVCIYGRAFHPRENELYVDIEDNLRLPHIKRISLTSFIKRFKLR